MPQQSELPLKIAIATYGHTAALKQGKIPIAGVKPEFIEVKPIIAAFRRMVRDVEFDVCEMAPATYMIARAAGSPFKALPVFIYRRFHHAGLVCRDDAGIRGPKDLEGKKAGVRAYSVTTGIWTRGILQNEYGVDISKVTWVVDDEEHVKSLRLPRNVVHAPPGRSLVDMMAAGELQAAFTDNAGIGRAGPPKDGWQASGQARPPSYVELFPDAPRLEAAWFRRTGIYPVHGLIVVKDELLAKHPWVAKALFDAFVESKERYRGQLKAGESVSDKDDFYRQMAAIVGDPLPYGVKANRPAIDALITYCHQQGLLQQRFPAEEMFVDPEAA
jgi:4,5-dihydroxyphthalate decarboxylase